MGPEIGIPVTRFRNLPFLRRLEFQPQTNHRRFIVDLKVEQSESQRESQGGCRRGSEQSAKANRRAPPSGLETFFPHLRPLVQENDLLQARTTAVFYIPSTSTQQQEEHDE